MSVRLTARAARDLADIRDRYREVDDATAARFLESLDGAIERMKMFPNGAPPVEGMPGVRRARVRRFPFGVFYRLEGPDIVVLRVLHTRRDPSQAASR
ncbi:type II toxin-antitoxin system RelE/ParE family toxin [Demequina pelophila]|uniref:type II toxin-antitoxin system RelE/ParE family toxin n=1 Tax=Demequina pelophila TaxID=1638984 RepID=UPI0007867AF1|nr:type II toxin-antitoxin system RelE/ParE family toxin [Demequina pelophila]